MKGLRPRIIVRFAGERELKYRVNQNRTSVFISLALASVYQEIYLDCMLFLISYFKIKNINKS